MSEVETDPQLNAMLLQNRAADLDMVTLEFNEFVNKFRGNIEPRMLDMATVILNAEPNISRLSFTFRAGEYNDNTYDGFVVDGPEIMLIKGVEVKDFQYGDYTLESDEWHGVWDYALPNPDVMHALNSLTAFIVSMKMLLSDKYGSRVRLIMDRNGLSDEHYDTGY